MEFVGLAVGIPGLLQTCVHGYRTLVSSKNIAKDASSLHAQLRVQEARLILIAQNWGLQVSDTSGDVSTIVRAVPQGLMGKMQLQTAAVFAQMIKETMNQIATVLTDSTKLTSRYGLRQEAETSSKLSSLLGATHLSRSISPLRRLRWSIIDKAAFAQLVGDLKAYNDALELYFPPQQRTTIGLALPLQFANVTSLDELESLREASEQYQALQQTLDLKTFRMKTEDDNALTVPSLEKSMSSVTFPTPHTSSLHELRTPAKFQMKTAFSIDDVRVLIEWKAYNDSHDEDRKRVIRDRVKSLAALLNRAANAKNLNALQCLGYFDDIRSSRIGFILALPSPSGNPNLVSAQGVVQLGANPQIISLYSILGADKPSESVPDLGSRISLALTLARNLLQLHAAGWLHKGLRSENVLFFNSTPLTPSAPPEITHPHLVGFDYSRPDTDFAITETLTTYSKTQDYYRHPSSIQAIGAANPVTSRYRRSFDVYSLGCILLEIGLWRRLEEFWKDKYSKEPTLFRERLIALWSKDLGRMCGKTYEGVVRLCLNGISVPGNSEQSSSDKQDLDAFYQAVVCKLQSCVV